MLLLLSCSAALPRRVPAQGAGGARGSPCSRCGRLRRPPPLRAELPVPTRSLGVLVVAVGSRIVVAISRHARAGMRRRVDLFQLLDRHLGVDLRRRQLRVAQHLLDEADVGSVLQHDRRHRVPEEVARTALADLSGIDVVAHHLRQTVRE